MFGLLQKSSPANLPLFFRRTIKEGTVIKGVGLHSGEESTLIFHPAESGAGISFVKKGLTEGLTADLDHVIDTSQAVTIGKGNFIVQTIEHLMYALFVLKITDLTIEIIGGGEIPILDGSAAPFIEALSACEFHDYATEIEPLIIEKPISVTDGDRYIVGLPNPELRISYSVDYNHPLLKDLSTEVIFSDDYFTTHIGHARTFGFLKDVEYLREKGLAQGGTTENVLVFTQDGLLNEPRFNNEALSHKILDMLGDLSLIRRPIIGHLLGSKGGHALDIAFAKKLIHQFEALKKAA